MINDDDDDDGQEQAHERYDHEGNCRSCGGGPASGQLCECEEE